MVQFILASKSPRRHFLLKEKGYKFQTSSIEISEILNENLSVERAIEQLALEKAQALVESGRLSTDQTYLILSADTVVYQGGEVLGKPKDQEHAFELLKRLSGESHQVITAFCLWHTGEKRYVLKHRISDVTFRELSDAEIRAYIATGDPMDKAGAYGIQSEGRHFVTKFTGGLENIAGLPVDLVEKTMTENNWHVNKESE